MKLNDFNEHDEHQEQQVLHPNGAPNRNHLVQLQKNKKDLKKYFVHINEIVKNIFPIK